MFDLYTLILGVWEFNYIYEREFNYKFFKYTKIWKEAEISVQWKINTKTMTKECVNLWWKKSSHPLLISTKITVEK